MYLYGRLGEANLCACSVAEIVPCNNARQAVSSEVVRRYFLPASFDSSSSILKSERLDTRAVVTL
jgi:hypothetical protein